MDERVDMVLKEKAGEGRQISRENFIGYDEWDAFPYLPSTTRVVALI